MKIFSGIFLSKAGNPPKACCLAYSGVTEGGSACGLCRGCRLWQCLVALSGKLHLASEQCRNRDGFPAPQPPPFFLISRFFAKDAVKLVFSWLTGRL